MQTYDQACSGKCAGASGKWKGGIMTPLSLTLRGFRGIRDGLGRDELSLDLEDITSGARLVAIAGSNGRGKSTLMDNMHPYLTMPSRAGVAGPGGFSYYDHVFLPESEKDLIWSHGGWRYRSHIVFRLNGKRKTEAFLFQQGARGWAPVCLDDGAVSDGKVETYERCLEAILGKAETFFTSVFSAQGKRQLTAYKNAEIKTLLGDLLGLDEIRLLGQRAAETARLLKAGLGTIRLAQTNLEDELRRVDSERTRMGGARSRVASAAAEKHRAQQALDVARERQRQLAAEKEQATQTELRRSELLAERGALIQSGQDATQSLDAQDARERQRLTQLQQRIAARAEQVQVRRQSLEDMRKSLSQILSRAGAVMRAGRRQVLVEGIVVARGERVSQCRHGVQRLAELQARVTAALQKMEAIEREAGQASLRAEELKRRFGLTQEVPCFGTDLQGRCKLLGDARAAKTLMPSADLEIARLSLRKRALNDELNALRAQCAALAESPACLNEAQRQLERARRRASRYAVLAGQAGEIRQARATLSGLVQELNAIAETGAIDETTEEFVERQQIAATCRAIAVERGRQQTQWRSALQRVEAAIAALPAPYEEHRLDAAARAVDVAANAVQAAEQAHVSAVQDAQSLELVERQAADLGARRAREAQRMAVVARELGNWTLFSKCLSNDGVIALAIDDAGPVLSGLANDLLLACYGGRFTVSIKTLVETGKGEPREGFDIVVHDSESTESKSVGLMSGGERVWINECLVRAVALYLAQHAGRRYATLFSDEADGPLDPERKRMFMAMKREVLRLGGYEQEYFVSQTPDLTATADAVIDLDSYSL
ncbi:DNA repair protein [Undibacterium sp. Jales W-56]|uniref:DNA repair protein n=1 Tax=Undibacterium sp. Jales W-56 TaxID=2897325 RepID=UPI0021D1F928|nr:DNA repair protein [Undibacterium sp. Jales W-56]MCU6435241.1 DNA repair protein [Undibacterium sp. Jales W-56]